ncbi:hypothetical protein GIB67_036140 [Kingdonia uniflora]|uniref:Uncharacterized protein n=1 Tax=Kingdonia uniflora TaxID=39325 RepID=A0A7J7N9L4_9MAGN|nr:hypothetical protein GIB67_036140 [Kingdonia uniflora]
MARWIEPVGRMVGEAPSAPRWTGGTSRCGWGPSRARAEMCDGAGPRDGRDRRGHDIACLRCPNGVAIRLRPLVCALRAPDVIGFDDTPRLERIMGTIVVGSGIAVVERRAPLFCLLSWMPDTFPFDHVRLWSKYF